MPIQCLNLEDEEFMGETRRFERYPVEVPARVELTRARRKDKVIFLNTYNLSASGAYFPEWQSIPVGSPIKAELYLFFENQQAVETIHDMVVMNVRGKVIRSDDVGTAVSFAENYQIKAYQCLVAGVNGYETDQLPAEAEYFEDSIRLFRKHIFLINCIDA